MRPSRLANSLAWQKFNHDRLDVEHWRAIDGVELGDDELGAVDPNNTADGAANAVWTVLAALRKDAHRRPRIVVSRVTRAGDDFRRLDLVEEE